MIIVKKVERKGNKITISLSDSTTLKLSSDIYRKYPFVAGEHLNERELKLLKEENEYFEAKKSALRFLSVRNHSSQELFRKLTKKKFPEIIVEKIISELISLGYVDDKKFAEQFLLELKRKFMGPLKIKNEMTKRGINRKVIDEVLNKYFVIEDLQKQLILDFLQKDKFPKRISNTKDLQKIYNHLVNRGFSPAVVLESLKEKYNLKDLYIN